MSRPFISLLFLIVAALPASAAQPSLYNPRTARFAPSEVQTRLGSQSGRIRYDARMIRAAQIATRRAHARTTWYCWRYVKDALLEADVISDRPQSAWAKQAGQELVGRFGFRQLPTLDPMSAPVGAVIVYGGADAGHVELRTRDGFVSDFISRTPYPRPVLGIYVKPA